MNRPPGLIDMGMIASIFLLSSAFQKGLPQKQLPPYILLAVLLISFLIPLAVFITRGISFASLVTLLNFFGCGSLVTTGSF